jgi:hypothetical protein
MSKGSEVVEDAAAFVKELGQAWQACKELGVSVFEFLGALEAGDTIDQFVAVVGAAKRANLPGGPDGIRAALRYARARRRAAAGGRSRGPKAAADAPPAE